MPGRHQRYGRKCEGTAARYLEKRGYRILERNFRTSYGEIDIIARDEDFIVFVEVKAKQTARFGNPKAAVTEQKQRKISKVALQYLKSTGQLTSSARFDVVAVHPSGDRKGIEVVKNAFDLCYF